MREDDLQQMRDGLSELESGLASIDKVALPQEMRERLGSIRLRVERAKSKFDQIEQARDERADD